MVVVMPHARVYVLGWSFGGCPSAVLLLLLGFLFGLLNQSCSSLVYIMLGIVPLFYTILSDPVREALCLVCMTPMHNGVGSDPVSLPQTPQLPCIRYSVIIAGSISQCDQYESSDQQVVLPVVTHMPVGRGIENPLCKNF